MAVRTRLQRARLLGVIYTKTIKEIDMNKLFGILLILVSIVLGLIGALQLLAGIENLIGGSFDLVYLLKRVAIAFIVLFFMYKAFGAGKKKFANND